MTKEFIVSVLRTILQMIGAALISQGLVPEEDWIQISGGIIAALSVYWMIRARWNTRKVPAP